MVVDDADVLFKKESTCLVKQKFEIYPLFVYPQETIFLKFTLLNHLSPLSVETSPNPVLKENDYFKLKERIMKYKKHWKIKMSSDALKK